MGLEDLRSRVVYEKPLTPNGWAEDLSIFKGATFNLAHNLGQMLHLRPNNRFEDLESVYLVGGGTHPGSGLPVIYEGAASRPSSSATTSAWSPAGTPCSPRRRRRSWSGRELPRRRQGFSESTGNGGASDPSNFTTDFSSGK